MQLSKIGRKNTVTIEREASLQEAAQAMREHHVGDVVVVESRNGRKVPVGILTDRDIVMATIALGAPTEPLAAGDIMSDELVTVEENWSVGKVIGLMKTKGVKRIPIIGREGELAGIITLEDIMDLLANEFAALAEVSGRQKTVEFVRRRKLA